MNRMPLKEYQTAALAELDKYCQAVRRHIDNDQDRPDRLAFEEVTGRRDEYFAPPNFAGTPYVCLRLPTGGGKTLLAAHAIGRIAHRMLRADRPAVLWITPGKTIRDQTLKALKEPTHPYRWALEDTLSRDVEVVTLEEAMLQERCISGNTALVIVTTIQSYRIRDSKGDEDEATRRIYRDNSHMAPTLDQAEKLPAWLTADLMKDENGLNYLSLANALRLRAPIVIMDEAHNARTTTSFDSLARFGPSFVLELTATPEKTHQPEHAKNPRYASNVLHAASALELQKEGMIKLPVELESREDWLDVLAATVSLRDDLEKIADRACEDRGLPFIRPVALIQAQNRSKTKETQTVEVVKEALIKQCGVDEDHIAVCAYDMDDLEDEEDLMATNCPIRYVLTVDKLREGWDCPFAYVLGSIGNTATATAVEQLLGRVLRMPYANPTRVPELDRAYAMVLSDDVVKTASELADRLIENCGFDENSVADALRVTRTDTQRRIVLDRMPIFTPPPRDELPATLHSKVEIDTEAGELRFTAQPTGGELQDLRAALTNDEDRAAVDAIWEKMRPPGAVAKLLTEYAKPFRLPRLTVEQDGRRWLLEPVELDEFAWDLDSLSAEIAGAVFPSDMRVGDKAMIALTEQGATKTFSEGEVRRVQLELVGEGYDWDAFRLVRHLDEQVHRGDSLVGLTLAESQAWLTRVVEHLTSLREIPLNNLVRRRHRLADVLRTMLVDHGRQQTRRAADALIDTRPEAIVTSDKFQMMIEEQAYSPPSLYDGRHEFTKHDFTRIGSMNGEEIECAIQIDKHENVVRWIRNAERTSQGGFCLPLSPGQFFPDFIVELTTGQTVLVEYKHEKLAAAEGHKRTIGELWAARSNGRCRFAWIVDKDWGTLSQKLSS